MKKWILSFIAFSIVVSCSNAKEETQQPANDMTGVYVGGSHHRHSYSARQIWLYAVEAKIIDNKRNRKNLEGRNS